MLMTTGGSNPNHQCAVLVNIPRWRNVINTGRDLRRCYRIILSRISNLHKGRRNLIKFPHQNTLPATIAFDLLGAGRELGWGFENAAEQALAAITGWFNDRRPALVPVPAARPMVGTRGQLRARRISNIVLLVPTDPNDFPERVEAAWLRA